MPVTDDVTTDRVRLFRAQPHRRRLFAPHHQVDVVLIPETVRHRAEETVGIGRKVDACPLRLEIKQGADERRILMGKSVVLLTSPCRSFEVVDGTDWAAPLGFPSLRLYFSISTQIDHEGQGTILLNLAYWIAIVVTIPRKAS
jgi:hypothetical protein